MSSRLNPATDQQGEYSKYKDGEANSNRVIVIKYSHSEPCPISLRANHLLAFGVTHKSKYTNSISQNTKGNDRIQKLVNIPSIRGVNLSTDCN